MKVVVRADASVQTGTGHVMRCLTLIDELISRGHHVTFAMAPIDVTWLSQLIESKGLDVVYVEEDLLDISLLTAMKPDWVVVDSYRIDPRQISRLNAHVPVLAFVDTDSRTIEATLYLDQNFGSDALEWPPHVNEYLLAGASYSLIRQDILKCQRAEPWKVAGGGPHVVAVMGGSDPTGSIKDVARALVATPTIKRATLVVAPRWWEGVTAITSADPRLTLIEPTPNLGPLYGSADVVISAAGSSSWEVCTLGIPAILIAVVDNQVPSLALVRHAGLAEAIDVVSDTHSNLSQLIRTSLTKLIADQELRKKYSQKSSATFDGRGKERVVMAMEEFTFRNTQQGRE